MDAVSRALQRGRVIMRLIDAELLLLRISDRYDAKKNIVPDNLAEGFVQMEKLIKEQPTSFDTENILSSLRKKEILLTKIMRIMLKNIIWT